jgi:hypothetical protein
LRNVEVRRDGARGRLPRKKGRGWIIVKDLLEIGQALPHLSVRPGAANPIEHGVG